MKSTQNSFKKALISFSLFSVIFSIAAGQSIEASGHLKSHSVKTLNVTGEPMALIQLFVPGAHIKVNIEDERIGLSQKDNLVSLYIDMDSLNVDVREELEKIGYSRKPDQVKAVLSKAFTIKETKNAVSLSIKD
ncbi:MAG: hypothetical protein NXH75_09110 [Halobacteriovoraceae bacterium]|nr:hypothetical protein [Halobacteriovoraceae bacterium]